MSDEKGFGRLIKIGALWKKTDKNGAEYLSGEITVTGEKMHISVWPNRYKEAEKQPDFRIMVSAPADGAEEKPKAGNVPF